MTGGLGPMAGATPSSLGVMDMDGPAVLVAQNTFARRIALDAEGQWQIKDQYNSVEKRGRDPGGRCARHRRRRQKGDRPAGQDQQVAAVPLPEGGGLSTLAATCRSARSTSRACHVADLDGDGRDDLLICRQRPLRRPPDRTAGAAAQDHRQLRGALARRPSSPTSPPATSTPTASRTSCSPTSASSRSRSPRSPATRT